MSEYDVAQICLNGHVITECLKLSPEKQVKFCPKCGTEAITKCKNCSAEIIGAHYVSETGYKKYEKPSYCHNCGEPYPWAIEKK